MCTLGRGSRHAADVTTSSYPSMSEHTHIYALKYCRSLDEVGTVPHDRKLPSRRVVIHPVSGVLPFSCKRGGSHAIPLPHSHTCYLTLPRQKQAHGRIVGVRFRGPRDYRLTAEGGATWWLLRWVCLTAFHNDRSTCSNDTCELSSLTL